MKIVTGASFETKTRKGFIKACHILAKGPTFSIDRPLVISIGGQMNVGKALVADAFLNALTEKGKNKKYDVPVSSKMAFEAEPAQAAHFPVRGFIMYEGELMSAHFIRQQEDLSRLLQQGKKQLIFISGDGFVEQADLQIDLNTPSFTGQQWHRSWNVSVLKTVLMNSKMRDMLSHLNDVREYQLYKKSMDI